MAAVLNHSETEWQAAVISGPPPLGPGAPPLGAAAGVRPLPARDLARHADLIREAGRAGARSYAAYSFAAMHVRYLLTELGVERRPPAPRRRAARAAGGCRSSTSRCASRARVDRVYDGWVDLAGRIVRPLARDPALRPGAAAGRT